MYKLIALKIQEILFAKLLHYYVENENNKQLTLCIYYLFSEWLMKMILLYAGILIVQLIISGVTTAGKSNNKHLNL